MIFYHTVVFLPNELLIWEKRGEEKEGFGLWVYNSALIMTLISVLGAH